ncbi:MAG: serine/threonine protein kinase [Planctomycetota bacterium]|nr:MAG: serine/threonine protein kinase [Planctomycetota bacterium]
MRIPSNLLPTKRGPSMSMPKVPGYKLLSKIAEGGSAAVYKGEKYNSQEKVALKIIHKRHLENKQALAEFYREAKLCLPLQHENIIQFKELVKNGTRPTIVMEYFPSQTLKYIIKTQKKLPLYKALRYLLQAAQALQYLHEKGIVHKDIKPENFLVGNKDRLKLIDLSLAETLEELSKKKWLSWLIKPKAQGTPTYIAPEQIQRKIPSPQTDIYSFGITCYEILTGHPPFYASDPNSLLEKHIKEKPKSILSTNPEIPKVVNDAVMKMMEKKPELRPKNLKEFLKVAERAYKSARAKERKKKKK